MHDPTLEQLQKVHGFERLYDLAIQQTIEAKTTVSDLEREIAEKTAALAQAEREYVATKEAMVEAGRVLDEARQEAHIVYPRPATNLKVLSKTEREEQHGEG